MRDRHRFGVGASETAWRLEEDVDLVKRCLAGERQAARELFRREYPRVNASLYRVLGASRESEDLVQEAFLEVFRSLGAWRGEALLSTWIDRISVRVAIHHLRQRKAAAVQLEVVPEPEDDEAPPDRRAQAREGVRRLYRALDELGAPARLAFTLHVIDGRSIAEIAALTGSSRVAVKVRVWRARREIERQAAADPVLAGYLDQGGKP
jgi:RNA polymerase sigma-70 factor (ECF subfamily)